MDAEQWGQGRERRLSKERESLRENATIEGQILVAWLPRDKKGALFPNAAIAIDKNFLVTLDTNNKFELFSNM